MNLILLGYCANLAYVIHGNEVSVSFEKTVPFWHGPFWNNAENLKGNRPKEIL